MKNQYSEKNAKKEIGRALRDRFSKDIGLCVYISHLLGNNPELVLHGGGNISVKSDKNVLYVKASGFDLSTISPAGFVPLNLLSLREIQSFSKLTDVQMMKILRVAKLDPEAPNPSVETLLHAFLPDKFVGHTHANAVLALTNQTDGASRCRRVFGDKVIVLPYIMSGFMLAKKAAEARQNNIHVVGIVILKHGLFTFAKTAKGAYDNMISLVTLADAEFKEQTKNVFKPIPLLPKISALSEISPIIRGSLGSGWVLDFRTSLLIKNFVNGEDLARYGKAGPVTPDHVIWTKPKPLILPVPHQCRTNFSKGVKKAVKIYEKQYLNTYRVNNKRHNGEKIMRDLTPRVILVPGVGLFGVGRSSNDASVSADLAEVTISVITKAEAVGSYCPASASDIFDVEYWSPEVTKLSKRTSLPLEGHIVLISGGGSGIGAATATAFAEQGAAIVVLDINGKSARRVAAEVGGVGLACDVTNSKDVRLAFDVACKTFGGVDIVVSNAGAAWQGEIGTVNEIILRKSFELNFFAHQSIAQNAVRIMRAQKLGGRLLFNISKQAINPGAEFGPYGIPKAATLSLMRQYALDHGKDGITSNAVNADRIRSGLLTSSMIVARSKARALSEANYMSGNLLGEEVTAKDVAKAFVDLALSPKTTAAVMTVDGGNIAAALR
jgi:rhamnose utilization protein RhaD (predicted bifunctional aldolase and dehydrogenase)/NAD(P)-dependent dehydrogenase (short-subunit alcohol dehydrogenase family)